MIAPALFTLSNGSTLMLDVSVIVAVVDETTAGLKPEHSVLRTVIYTNFGQSFAVNETLEDVMHNIPRSLNALRNPKKTHEPTS